MPTVIPYNRAVLLAFIAGMVSACSSMRPYESSAPENMNISVDVRSGSASMEVYSADHPCETSYQGTLDLSNKKVKTAIPANKSSYLVFRFSGGSYVTGYHSTTYGIYLTPRPGYQYETEVSYVDSMYGATVFEQDVHGGGRHKIPNVKPACASK